MSETLDRNPNLNLEVVRQPHTGFTSQNTAGLTELELVSLNRALHRLMGRGLTIRQGKRVLQAAVSDWLHPADASLVTTERLLGWQ